MRNVKRILALFLSFGIVFLSTQNLYADETSELILKLLVKKGIVSQKEVDELKAEIKKAEVKVPEIADIQKHVEKSSWAEKIKFKGDIRLRNEYMRPGSGAYVNRQRIRARAGLEAELTDTVKAGIALASGGTGNPRSTNQSLQDIFGTKAFDLDMVYVDWKPYKYLRLTGGKYENPLYSPGDLIWDSDLRFEGASTNLKHSLKEVGIPLDVMANAGIFVLDDISPDRKNPFLYAFQGGIGSSAGDIFDWKGYVGYLDFAHIKGTDSDDLVPTTGRADAQSDYYYDYDIVELSGDMTFHLLEKNAPKPLNVPLTLFGDYIQNLADGQKRHGWELGAKLGKKPKAFGDWLAVYNFRWLDNNAFPDDFPDADSFRGNTNGFGHEIIFTYGLTKNINIEVDYYLFRDKTQGTDPNDKWGHTLQTDLNIKF